MAEVKYHLIGRGNNVVRELDVVLARLDHETGEWERGNNVVRELGVMLAYLEHETGEWVQSNSLFPNITFEASTKEITEAKAKDWVAKRLPRLKVEWI